MPLPPPPPPKKKCENDPIRPLFFYRFQADVFFDSRSLLAFVRVRLKSNFQLSETNRAVPVPNQPGDSPSFSNAGECVPTPVSWIRWIPGFQQRILPDWIPSMIQMLIWNLSLHMLMIL